MLYCIHIVEFCLCLIVEFIYYSDNDSVCTSLDRKVLRADTKTGATQKYVANHLNCNNVLTQNQSQRVLSRGFSEVLGGVGGEGEFQCSYVIIRNVVEK